MLSKNRKIKKEGRYQNILFSILIGAFLLAIVGFLVTSNLKINQKRGELMDKIEELKREIQLLSERNEQLKAGILRTGDYDYWKGKLYEYGYFEPGVQPIVIIPPSDETKEEEKTTEEKGLLDSIKDSIKEMFGF